MTKPLVTRESLQTMLDSPDEKYVERVIGRALVAIFNRQTEVEQSNNHTSNLNGVGFVGCDALSGSLTAKSYIKHKHLLGWQTAKWTKKGTNGFARLCKYHKQLNEIALQKQR